MLGLNCESCGCKVHLEYGNKIVKLTSGKKIGFANAPILVCVGCGSRYIPYMTNTLITEILKLEEETENRTMKETDTIVRECDEFEENEDRIAV